jgi:hypothetical protein
MPQNKHEPQTFVEMVLAFLELHFPWLSSNAEEQVSGADTVQELTELHEDLTQQRDASRREAQAASKQKR